MRSIWPGEIQKPEYKSKTFAAIFSVGIVPRAFCWSATRFCGKSRGQRNTKRKNGCNRTFAAVQATGKSARLLKLSLDLTGKLDFISNFLLSYN